MKVSSPPAPKAPNPKQAAKAQADLNKDAAIEQQKINMINQITPEGTLIYKKNPNGYFTATTTLSPEAQAAYDLEREFDMATNTLGLDQTKKLAGLLDKPVSLDNDVVEARLMELGRKRLDPMLAERRAAMETKLYNQGVRPGTEAWAREMGGLAGGTEHTGSVNMAENDAYNQLLLTGRGQSIEEILAERNQPINEITALMGAQQIARPSFVSTPQAQVAAPNQMGMMGNNYLGALDAWKTNVNANAQQQAAMWGAAGSALGTGLGGWASGGFAT